MSYLLLKNRSECPECRCALDKSPRYANCDIADSWHFKRHHCGAWLFFRPIAFQQYEDDGNLRRYWLWTNGKGWVSRSYIMNPELKAQVADEKEENIAEDYGKQSVLKHSI